MYLLSKQPSYLSILYCTFAEVNVHSSIFIASSALGKVTTSISWKALNRTQCDQTRLRGRVIGSILVEEGPLMAIVERCFGASVLVSIIK